MSSPLDPLVDAGLIDRLRSALVDYTVDGVLDLLGPPGQSALDRGDLDGVRRGLPPNERLSALVRLFILGLPVPVAAARPALGDLDLAALGEIVTVSGDEARARVDIRPYASDLADRPWWVVSDFSPEVRSGPLRRDYVLGIGTASLTLAQATPRDPVDRALDIGTGSGVQALHLAGHAARITATDISDRALRMAATTAALSGYAWTLRSGSALDPVAGESFDLIVANPPFVVSAGFPADGGGYQYRDSGMPGDGISRLLTSRIPQHLAPGGVGQLLANWVIGTDGEPWEQRVGSWLDGAGCDAWVWQREVASPGEYISLWLRDAGERPGSARWSQRYDEWAGWFDTAGVAAVGMGLITLWRTDGDPVIVCEDVPHQVEQPSGAYIAAWIGRNRWLAGADDERLSGAVLRADPSVVRVEVTAPGPAGWATAGTTLRQTRGACWELEADEAIAALVGGCDGHTPVGALVDVLAAVLDRDRAAVLAAALPVVRDLVRRGLLELVTAP